MNILFAAVFAMNSLAMTVLLIVFGLLGESAMAADVGIVQGASLALFYALSANARSLILNQARPLSAQVVMVARLWILLPISGVTFWLGTVISGVDTSLAAILILRRSVEWLGEVQLSEWERSGNRRFASHYLLAQLTLLVFALAWNLGNMPMPMLGLLLWALLPLLFSARFIWDALLGASSELRSVWVRMLPHFGSTAIIGITVYVFRLLLLLILGKHQAGDLFTAFAIGGILGSVFANALGPSVVMQEKNNGSTGLPSRLRAVVLGSLVLGGWLIAVYALHWDVLDWSGKSTFFWGATGFSMLGGGIMIYAQLIRFRLLQNHEDADLFGPDTIMNILVIAAVPLLANIFGTKVLTTLYLFSSLLALIFYWSYQKGEHLHESRSVVFQERVRMALGVMLLLPLFFQLAHGIFRDPSFYFNSGGALRLLPIPVSVIACYGGIVLLGGYRRATVSLTFIFLSCVLMVGSVVITSHENGAQEQVKFILLIQFLLPMFGLVLGQLYERIGGEENAVLERGFLYTLAAVVPVQLLCSWLQGYKFLLPHLYLFSVYQHLQYIPAIFVSAFLVAYWRLWSCARYKKLLLALTPLMGVYAAASMSMLAIAMLILGMLGFAVYQYLKRAESTPVIMLLLAALMTWGYLHFEKDAVAYKFTFLATQATQGSEGMPPNMEERMHYWKYYAENIASSANTLLIGHAQPPDRAKYPSAHNYYLDFIYNFGAIALLPMLFVLIHLLTTLYRCRRQILDSPGLLGFAMVVLFLIVVDNSFKVGLRQPYPGIFSFFLMGVLISRLSWLEAGLLCQSDDAGPGRSS